MNSFIIIINKNKYQWKIEFIFNNYHNFYDNIKNLYLYKNNINIYINK